MDPAESYILIENNCTIFKGLVQYGGGAGGFFQKPPRVTL
jgi:hypothetical protein